MARDPARRAASRAADRERKKAKRALERAQRELSKGIEDKYVRAKIESRVREAQSDIAASYATRDSLKKFKYEPAAQAALKDIQKRKYATKAELQKVDFQQELTRASAGLESALGEKGLLKSKLFYKATQTIWQYKDISERNALIIKATKSQTLEQAYEKIMGLFEIQEILAESATDYTEEIDTESIEGRRYLDEERNAIDSRKGGSPRELILISANLAKSKAWG